jgi:hypothetical protein
VPNRCGAIKGSFHLNAMGSLPEELRGNLPTVDQRSPLEMRLRRRMIQNATNPLT